MSTKTAQMPMIALSAIVIGKTNPRKSFDEDAIKELAESIKSKGVIQPILLRPTDKDGAYELVCGERRYRASQIAGKEDIPAYIRQMTDDEALEAQLTENLQRKDVHPMDEAFSFKILLEKNSVEEVAARVGKKDYFINQRMKLNSLLPEWQKLFYNNFFNLTTALKIAVLPEASQKEMLKDSGVTGKDVDKAKGVSINDYRLNQYRGDLKRAAFDIADATLDKKMGACSGCQFNSAVANLFPDAAKVATCSNISCYKHKSDVAFDRELAKALEDPTIVFISSNYGCNDDKIKARLQKENHNILTNYDYSDAGTQEPDIIAYTEWLEAEDEDEGEEALAKRYEEYVAQEKKVIESTQKKIASGKFLKAFIVDGTGKGHYKYIEMHKRSGSTSKDAKKSARERVESGKATAADIDTEIARLRDNEKRAKELDREKVQKQIVEHIKAEKLLATTPAKLTHTDGILTIFLLTEEINYSNEDVIKKVSGLTRNPYGGDKAEKIFKQLEDLSDQQLAGLVRNLIFSKFNTSLPPNNGAFMLRKMAEDLGNVPIADIEEDQRIRAEKRHKKVEARIADLQAQKKQVKPKPEPKAKPATKKAAKKK